MIAGLAASTLTIGLPVVLASSASADITAPAQNAVLRGNATLSASGATDSGVGCIAADGPLTQLQLRIPGGAEVFSNDQGGTGAKSVVIDTHNYPNGSYIARANERNRSGFLYCPTSWKTTDRSVTIDNITQLAYTGDTAGAQNTSVTVKAKLTDPNLAASVLPGRVVTFALSGGTSVNGTTDANGVATATLPVSGPPRTATLTASFAQTAYYKGSTAPVTFEVTKNPSTTTLLQPASVVHGEPVSFTAQVAANNGSSTPTGTIQFTVDGNDLGAPVPISGGAASSPATAALSTGSHTIGARYSGDANVASSTASTKQLTIGKAPTSTVLTSTGSPTVSGQAVTFTASVSVLQPGAGDPAGGVQFNVDGDPYGTAIALNGDDKAELTINNLPAGNHDVQATYNGNADFAASSSATLTHGVDRADTTLQLTSSNPSAVAGEPLSYTAHVTVVGPGSGDPSGSVQFFADGDPIGSPVALNNGSAVSSTVKLPSGSHAITANYEGDNRFAGASGGYTQAVAAAQTTTVVTVDPSPSVFGQSVTIRAAVTPQAPATGQPTGLVQFTIDGQPGPYVTLDGGIAELELSTLSRGSHQVKAVYFSSDPSFFTSTSATVGHTVNKAATKTTVTSSSPVAVFGQPVTFTAIVAVLAPGAGNPAGTVTFTDGDTVIGTAPVSSLTGGVASIKVDSLGVGQHAVVATYEGDDSFSGSNGTAAQKVQRAQTSTIVASTANPSQPGSPVRFTATVSPIAPGAGVPGGTVQFKVNGAALGAPAALTDGTATSADFSNLSPGTYRISAVYSGDPRFVASTGLLDQGNGQAVGKAGTALELQSDDDAAEPGQPVTFTATVRTVAPATGRATGVVQFWDGDTLLGAGSLAPASAANTSVASYTTTALTPGTHEIRAVYAGNANFDGSSATTAQDVTTIATVTGIESSASPSAYGDTVTLKAVVADTLSAAGRPTGTVTFLDGQNVLGTVALTTVNGRQEATLQVSGLASGDHTLRASYSGSSSRAASVSPDLTQVVQRAATRLDDLRTTVVLGSVSDVYATLRDSRGNPLPGQTLTFRTATSLPGGDGQRLLCETQTDQNGVGHCAVQSRWRGMVTQSGFDVFYGGTANYQPTSDHGGRG
jgi:hypothetical protein